MNCNFFCEHCGSSAGRKVFPDELKTEEIKKAFREIAEDFNPKEIMVAITGGEPLLRKDLFEVMEYAHSLGFEWGMVTNGYLIDQQIIDKMKKSGMCSIDVSIDGMGEMHDRLRNVKGAYDKALNAVRLLTKNDFLKVLRITTTINKKNIHQLDEMYKEFLPLGITGWRLLAIEPIGRAENRPDLQLSKSELTHLLNFIKEKRRKSKINITFGCSQFYGPEYEDEIRNYFFFCSTGINIGSILYNGDIFVCPSVPRRPEFVQGNVKKDRFSDVWNNKFSQFRNKDRTECDKCKKCEHWEDCLGGAFHAWDFNNKKPKFCYFE